MNGFDLVMVFAVILFSRLGIRLVMKYIKMKKQAEAEQQEENPDEKENMIKFFRHIRQRMILENRFSKYLAYAIGEIVLVVVGILIALQINMWNENRKNDKLKDVYILSLIKDLETDVNHFGYCLDLAIEENQRINSIRNILNAPDASLATLDGVIMDGLSFLRREHYIMLATTENPVVNDNTFQSLQSSGQITLLDNDLQETFARFYCYHRKYSLLVKEIMSNKNNIYEDFITSIPFRVNPEQHLVGENLNEQLWSSVEWDKVRIRYAALLNAYHEMNLKNEFLNSIRSEKTEILIQQLKES